MVSKVETGTIGTGNVSYHASYDTGYNIGAIRRNISDVYSNTVIDSTRIYSRALPAHEILSNYNSANIEFQTRVGADTSPDDGDWDAWSSTTGETAIDSMDNYPVTGCTGGTTTDGGKTYVFTSDGTFTCTTGGNVEVLMVAGGGAGGGRHGGGGGGGGSGGMLIIDGILVNISNSNFGYCRRNWRKWGFCR